MNEVDSFFHRLGMNVMNARLVTDPAGTEVTRMSQAFDQWLRENSDPARESYGSVQSARLPVWMGNTAADFVIRPSAAQDFLKSLVLGTTDPSLRYSYVVPLGQCVPHNPMLLKMLDSIRQFFGFNE